MSTINRRQLRPQYPVFSEHTQPAPQPFGPPDMWPSGLNSGYTVYSGAYGRHLAGFSGVDDMHAEGIDTYPNELNMLAAADDAAGNGVFDPNGSHGNVHPNEGVFADHLALPGYVDREVFYQPGEVQDIPGGGTTMYVPGGAVAFQQGQPETLRENRLLWELPNNATQFFAPTVRKESTVDAPTGTQAIGTLTAQQRNAYVIAGVAGVSIGLMLTYWLKKGK